MNTHVRARMCTRANTHMLSFNCTLICDLHVLQPFENARACDRLQVGCFHRASVTAQCPHEGVDISFMRSKLFLLHAQIDASLPRNAAPPRASSKNLRIHLLVCLVMHPCAPSVHHLLPAAPVCSVRTILLSMRLSYLFASP